MSGRPLGQPDGLENEPEPLKAVSIAIADAVGTTATASVLVKTTGTKSCQRGEKPTFFWRCTGHQVVKDMGVAWSSVYFPRQDAFGLKSVRG